MADKKQPPDAVKAEEEQAAASEPVQQPATTEVTSEQPKAAKAKQQPSIGRVVHYASNRNPITGVIESRHLTALITDPEWQVVPRFNEDGSERSPVQALIVFPPMMPPYPVTAVEDPDGADGTWHWPEYVPAQ